jgi:hypothetical protein
VLDRPPRRSFLDQVERPVIAQDADVQGDADEGFLRVVGEFLGAQRLPRFDVESEQPLSQRVLQRKIIFRSAALTLASIPA